MRRRALTAGEAQEVADVLRDFSNGVRAQLAAEDDARATTGALFAAARRIAMAVAGWCAIVLVYGALMLCLHGCACEIDPDVLPVRAVSAAEARYEALLSADDASRVPRPPPLEPAVPPHPVFARFTQPTVLLFSGRRCGPCRLAPQRVAELQRKGWPVETIVLEDDPQAFDDCDVGRMPTWICVRRGVECGRYIGTSWRELWQMLRDANAVELESE